MSREQRYACVVAPRARSLEQPWRWDRAADAQARREAEARAARAAERLELNYSPYDDYDVQPAYEGGAS